jgi:hypothetical protein
VWEISSSNAGREYGAVVINRKDAVPAVVAMVRTKRAMHVAFLAKSLWPAYTAIIDKN